MENTITRLRRNAGIGEILPAVIRSAGQSGRKKYGWSEQSGQMRRGIGRLIIEMGRAFFEKYRNVRHSNRLHLNKAPGRDTRSAATGAVAMPAAVCIGRAFLTGMGLGAGVLFNGAVFVEQLAGSYLIAFGIVACTGAS